MEPMKIDALVELASEEAKKWGRTEGANEIAGGDDVTQQFNRGMQKGEKYFSVATLLHLENAFVVTAFWYDQSGEPMERPADYIKSLQSL